MAALGVVTTGGLLWQQSRLQAPRWVSAVRKPTGQYAVVALAADGRLIWEFGLPHRGHSVVPSPDGQLLAAFPRRPGQTIWLLDSTDGRLLRTLQAGPGRQMNGHGVFSADGRSLLVTETVFGETTHGEIAVYDVRSGALTRRFASGGLDPHQCLWCGGLLAVAHGGYIEFPNRSKPKQLDPLRPPNLAWLDASSGQLRRADVLADPGLSIRHLAADGEAVFAGFQHDDGPAARASLLGYATPAQPLQPMTADATTWAAFNGYVGSVALDATGLQVIATSPKGGVLGIWDRRNLAFAGLRRLADVCGVAADEQGWVASSGFGVVMNAAAEVVRTDYAFDNHLAVI